jgi:hypothetical protein
MVTIVPTTVSIQLISPVAEIMAIVVSLLDHVPPAEESVSLVTAWLQILVIPLIGDGVGAIVTVCIAGVQPVIV